LEKYLFGASRARVAETAAISLGAGMYLTEMV